MEMVNKDIQMENLERDSRACLDIASKILKQKRGYEVAIMEDNNNKLIKKFIDMIDEGKFDTEEKQEGARILLNELLIK